VQEVFAVVMGKLGDFQHQATGGGFRAWLWTITHNKLREHYRRERHEALAEGGSSAQRRMNALADVNSLSDDDPTDDVQLAQLLRRAMTQVEGEFEAGTWRAFWRTVIDAVPTNVVAAELGVSAAAIRQSRSRVLRRLREQMGVLFP
jgi:RNA polymerase sigma-70 factor (ECF subfamily)